jgi:hypothetical protein
MTSKMIQLEFIKTSKMSQTSKMSKTSKKILGLLCLEFLSLSLSG